MGPAILVAFALRILFLAWDAHKWLEERVEISTPLNSWSRLKEGVALLKEGVVPYEGDIFHESPITLQLFRHLTSNMEFAAGLMFVIIDILVAVFLAKAASLYQEKQLNRQTNERSSSCYGKGVDPILVLKDDSVSATVAAVYLCNPFGILSCGGYCTISLTHLGVAWALWMALRGNIALAALGLALATHFSLYPVMLLCPVALMAYKEKGIVSVALLVVWFTIWSGVVLMISYYLCGSWNFLTTIYGVILTVPDLTPNVGLFWYFFTEVFDHFRVFFLCVFQINAFIYTLPLSIRFSGHPMFLAYILLSLIALFKSYPCVGDLSLPLALLPLWTHTFRYMRFVLPVIIMFLVASIAGPILWHLWIHTGSANANFFFAMTITYCLAQNFLVIDVINAFLTHQYDLKHGIPRLDQQGKPVRLRLQ